MAAKKAVKIGTSGMSGIDVIDPVLPEAVMAKSGVSFDVGMLARVRFDASSQNVSRVLAARLAKLWNISKHLTGAQLEVFERLEVGFGRKPRQAKQAANFGANYGESAVERDDRENGKRR